MSSDVVLQARESESLGVSQQQNDHWPSRPQLWIVLSCSTFGHKGMQKEADVCYLQRQTIVDSFCLSPPSSEISAPGQEVGSMMRTSRAQGRLCKKHTHSMKQNSSCYACVLYTLSITVVKSGKHNGISLTITLTSMTKRILPM